MKKPSPLDNIAAGITAHFNRIEADPSLNFYNPPRGTNGGIKPYYGARAFRSGSRVGVIYVSYQGETYLPKDEATAYLEWLDAGNVGTHGMVGHGDAKPNLSTTPQSSDLTQEEIPNA